MNAELKKCSLILCLIFLCSLTGGEAFAAGNAANVSGQMTDRISVQWTNTTSVEADLSFDGSRADCGACVIGNVGTTEISGKVTLARKNSNGTYTTVKTWSDLEASGNKLIFDKDYYVSTGYTYRLTITATVYNNDVGETVSCYHEAYASK